MGPITKDSRGEVAVGQQLSSQRREVPVAPHTLSRPTWSDLLNLTMLPWCL